MRETQLSRNPTQQCVCPITAGRNPKSCSGKISKAAVCAGVHSSQAMLDLEPATPPAVQQRDDPFPSCSTADPSQFSLNDPSRAQAKALAASLPWGSWPRVGAQWAVQQETIQVGQVLAECSLPQSLHQQQQQQQELMLSEAGLPSNPNSSQLQAKLVSSGAVCSTPLPGLCLHGFYSAEAAPLTLHRFGIACLCRLLVTGLDCLAQPLLLS